MEEKFGNDKWNEEVIWRDKKWDEGEMKILMKSWMVRWRGNLKKWTVRWINEGEMKGKMNRWRVRWREINRWGERWRLRWTGVVENWNENMQ